MKINFQTGDYLDTETKVSEIIRIDQDDHGIIGYQCKEPDPKEIYIIQTMSTNYHARHLFTTVALKIGDKMIDVDVDIDLQVIYNQGRRRMDIE